MVLSINLCLRDVNTIFTAVSNYKLFFINIVETLCCKSTYMKT